MDLGDLDTGNSVSIRSDEFGALEAMVCLDSPESPICLIAWLFCVEERVQMVDPEVAFVTKDTFLLVLGKDFCPPMVVTLGKMIVGVDDKLHLVGLVA